MSDFDAAYDTLFGTETMRELERQLPQDEIARVCRDHRWKMNGLGNIREQGVANLIFHMLAVNPTDIVRTTIKLALEDVGVSILAAGGFGLAVAKAINGLDDDSRDAFIVGFKHRMLQRYTRLSDQDVAARWRTTLNRL